MATIGVPPRPAGHFDVPLADVADEMRDLKAQATREAELIEQRHQYYDLDPDSACCLPGCTCVNCPPGGQS